MECTGSTTQYELLIILFVISKFEKAHVSNTALTINYHKIFL